MAMFFGFNPPFLGGPQSVLSRQEDTQLIMNDIMQFLMTVPGDRVMRPTFGAPIRTLVFDKMTSDTMLLSEDIRRRLVENEPRVNFGTVFIRSFEDKNSIFIKITGVLKDDIDKQINIERFIQLPR